VFGFWQKLVGPQSELESHAARTQCVLQQSLLPEQLEFEAQGVHMAAWGDSSQQYPEETLVAPHQQGEEIEVESAQVGSDNW